MEIGEENGFAVREHSLKLLTALDPTTPNMRSACCVSHETRGESTNTSLASSKLGPGHCALWSRQVLERVSRTCSRRYICIVSSTSSPVRPLRQQAC